MSVALLHNTRQCCLGIQLPARPRRPRPRAPYTIPPDDAAVCEILGLVGWEAAEEHKEYDPCRPYVKCQKRPTKEHKRPAIITLGRPADHMSSVKRGLLRSKRGLLRSKRGLQSLLFADLRTTCRPSPRTARLAESPAPCNFLSPVSSYTHTHTCVCVCVCIAK
jgi:hypothetical protein